MQLDVAAIEGSAVRSLSQGCGTARERRCTGRVAVAADINHMGIPRVHADRRIIDTLPAAETGCAGNRGPGGAVECSAQSARLGSGTAACAVRSGQGEGSGGSNAVHSELAHDSPSPAKDQLLSPYGGSGERI